MAVFKRYSALSTDGEVVSITIASGPVIFRDGKVLLDKHGDDDFWKFPGGRVHDNESFQQTAIREVKEELGVDVVLHGEPAVLAFDRKQEGKTERVMLVHYRATMSGEVRPGRDVREWAWHDVKNLPKDCAPNIKAIVEHFSS